MSSHDELLVGYLAHAEAVAHERKDTNFWAVNELADLMRDDSDGAWQIIVELVGRASDEETLGYVAAGALEDLICTHPDAMIDRVESRARQDARFCKAIARVWDGHGSRKKYVRGWTCSWPKNAVGECRRTSRSTGPLARIRSPRPVDAALASCSEQRLKG